MEVVIYAIKGQTSWLRGNCCINSAAVPQDTWSFVGNFNHVLNVIGEASHDNYLLMLGEWGERMIERGLEFQDAADTFLEA